MSSWSPALVCATALHAGFQLTVTAVAYPALVRTAPQDFARAHARHARSIVPLVAVVYGSALIATVGAVVVRPRSAWAWVAAGATATAVGTTAFRAAPVHTALGRHGPEPRLLRSLVRADRVRTLAALLAAGAALAYARDSTP